MLSSLPFTASGSLPKHRHRGLPSDTPRSLFSRSLIPIWKACCSVAATSLERSLEASGSLRRAMAAMDMTIGLFGRPKWMIARLVLAGVGTSVAILLAVLLGGELMMTYCLEHLTRKMLLMPVVPFEANKSCYVCSETPLLLEINTHSSKLRDFIEKIVKSKLGMNYPLIMLGSTLIYEVGDDLEEDVAASYSRNLDKVRNFSLWNFSLRSSTKENLCGLLRK